ncbi:MAG: amino acid ABC transporter substrate-binding protein [Planctomycetes bacterium]|nr:amino acid ABC transporter substrate-binding protein [Planctomycetota bacterium]
MGLVLRFVLLAVLFLVVSCGGPEVRDPQPLVVGSDLSNPPFGMFDDVPSGFEVDLCRALAESLGRELRYQRLPFETLIPAVVDGRIDIACATIGVTSERREFVAFTEPYCRTSIAVLVEAWPRGPNSREELRGRPVYAAAGTTSERAVRHHLPEVSGVFDAKGATGIDLLLRGEVDAVVMDGPDAYDLATGDPDRFRILVPCLDVEEYAIAVSSDHPELLRQLDEALDELRSRGRIAALLEAHGIVLDATAAVGEPAPP